MKSVRVCAWLLVVLALVFLVSASSEDEHKEHHDDHHDKEHHDKEHHDKEHHETATTQPATLPPDATNVEDKTLSSPDFVGVVTAGSPKLLDSNVRYVEWLGQDKQTALLLSTNHVLYRSIDGGQEWVSQTSKLDSPQGVQSFHVSKVDPNVIFFIGVGKENWITRDMGKSYERVDGLKFVEVQLHPTQAGWILAGVLSAPCDPTSSTHSIHTSASTPAPSNAPNPDDPEATLAPTVAADAKADDTPKEECNKQLHVSKDFGKTWEKLTSYVVQFDWAPKGRAENMIYACVHNQQTGRQQFGIWNADIDFVMSDDWFKTTKVVVPNGNRVLFTRDFVFVAAVNPKEITEVHLFVNRDNATSNQWLKAKLPVELTQRTYTILDATEGTVFMHVNNAEDPSLGMVYASDSSGTSFTLSLPNNRRVADGKCDFTKIEGLEGIFIANFIEQQEKKIPEENFNEEEGSSSPKFRVEQTRNVKTVITFDKGGEWNFLKAPEKDVNGVPIECAASDSCYLHLNGENSKFGPVYATASAVGLILATGNVGPHLFDAADSINTYMSRDGGLTWLEIAKGSHIYEFANHGGLIVMANDHAATDTILYSADEGLTWKSHKFTDTPLHVENIVIEEFAATHSLLILGYQDAAGVVVHVDFKGLHERPCKGADAPGSQMSDYELWTPSDGRSKNCLLGHTVSYIRRRRSQTCYNPEEKQPIHSYQHCACTAADFECDYGYRRELTQTGENGRCIVDDLSPSVDLHVESCEGFYLQTRGYRRVVGDTCIGGSEFLPVLTPCPVGVSHSHLGTALLIILSLLAVSLCIVTAFNRIECLRNCYLSSKEKLFGSYRPVSADEHRVRDTLIDDDFGIEDDMGNSAELIQDDPAMMKFASHPKPSSKQLPTAAPLPPSSAPKDVKVPVISPPSGVGPAVSSTSSSANLDEFNSRA
eukprot:TRINITY_DN105_c0_g1_i2.p1 TRINITY_DN105_c0_g1~~TRINITY_DN105_c0_g1_i2.p1  ORF type:complete len:936 (+),score=350.77 TRINITY_DN105_c0_g1_i2:76-2883(+)